MKQKYIAVFAIILSCFYTTLIAQNDDVSFNPNKGIDTTKKSIKSAVETNIGTANFRIDYHSPGVRKRVIWGGLVPYHEVWVTGAHNATTLHFNKDITVNNTTIPAGDYALFTIPAKKEWIVIINKNHEQHLAADYDKKEDVVRLKVKAKKNKHTERLQYFIEPKGNNKGKIGVAWEKIKIEIPFEVIN